MAQLLSERLTGVFPLPSLQPQLGPEGWATIILEKLGIGADRLTPERYAELYFKSVEKKYAAIKEMDGASAFLEFCAKNGVPVAIATSSPRDSFDKKMKSHPKILDLVQVVVCEYDITPNPILSYPILSHPILSARHGPLTLSSPFPPPPPPLSHSRRRRRRPRGQKGKTVSRHLRASAAASHQTPLGRRR